MQLPKLTKIKWLDSEAVSGWQTIGTIAPDYRGTIIQTIAFLLKENDEVVIVSSSVSSNNSAIDCLAIPKCAILERQDRDGGQQI